MKSTTPTLPDTAPKSGKHRLHAGTCLDGGRIVGATPAQFAATDLIPRSGGNLKPRTRRAAR